MEVRDIFDTLKPHLNETYVSMAAKVGWSKQQLAQKFKTNSLRVNDLYDLMEANGVEILYRIKKTGEIFMVDPTLLKRKGYGKHTVGVVNRVRYNTGTSNALSNSFYADGENEFDSNGEAQELYIDKSGRYFFVNYRKDEENGSIQPTTAAIAKAFIEMYGTQIFKKTE